jgi:HEAT repeat protein
LERELRKGDAVLRTYTAVALGKVPDQRAIPILIECLNDAEASVRWCAAKSLGQVGDDSALEPLRRALADSSEDVRANAEEAIEKIISGFRDSPE